MRLIGLLATLAFLFRLQPKEKALVSHMADQGFFLVDNRFEISNLNLVKGLAKIIDQLSASTGKY